MDLSRVASLAVALLTPPRTPTGAEPTESRTLLAVKSTLNDGAQDGGDGLSVRLRTLAFSLSQLMEAHSSLSEQQTRKTVTQNALRSLEIVRSELEEIERLVDVASEGGLGENELQDIQGIIGMHLARIDDISSSTRHMGVEILTGESVHIVTDVVSGKGFELRFPEVSSSALGLGSLNVVTMNADEAVEMVGSASDLLDTAISQVESQSASVESVLEKGIETLQGCFADLRSSEKLGVPPDSKWLTAGIRGGVISSGTLRTSIGNPGLTADIVSVLLR